MASTYLSRTASSGSNQIYTASCWVKRTGLSASTTVLSTGDGSADNNARMLFIDANDKIEISYYNAGYTYEVTTNRVLRDTSAWYHLVVAVDTTQATASDRIKIWVNGVQETSFETSSYPSLNATFNYNSSAQYIGDLRGSGIYSDFVLSHLNYIDGTAYDASAFGEYDANGVWKIKTSPSVTYGTNGFFILKDGNSVTDQSGNGNNFTVGGGTLTNTEDNPSNVFATLNSLNYTSSAVTYSNGNTKGTYPGFWIASQGTIGGMNGKYFWEAKVNSGNNANLFYGICRPNIDLDTSPQNQTGVICQHINGDRYVDGTYTASTAEALVNGNILGVALDLDSATKTVKFYKNGTLLSSGSSINLTSTYDNEFVLPFFAGNNSSASSIWETNFGNGYFSTTAVSSAGTNASGNGIFEYDVPTGYTALCTKGLNGE